MRRGITALLAAALLALAAPLLTACATPPIGDTREPLPDPGGYAVFLAEGWAKAGEAGGMTGVFGVLMNGTQGDLVIESIESEAAGAVELHEVVGGVMQEIPGDVTMAAGQRLELAPGANHIMLMDLTRALLPGDEVTFTIRFSDGTSKEFTVPVKDYAGANESYEGGGGEHADEHTGEHEHSGHAKEDG